MKTKSLIVPWIIHLHRLQNIKKLQVITVKYFTFFWQQISSFIALIYNYSELLQDITCSIVLSATFSESNTVNVFMHIFFFSSIHGILQFKNKPDLWVGAQVNSKFQNISWRKVTHMLKMCQSFCLNISGAWNVFAISELVKNNTFLKGNYLVNKCSSK